MLNWLLPDDIDEVTEGFQLEGLIARDHWQLLLFGPESESKDRFFMSSSSATVVSPSQPLATCRRCGFSLCLKFVQSSPPDLWTRNVFPLGRRDRSSPTPCEFYLTFLFEFVYWTLFTAFIIIIIMARENTLLISGEYPYQPAKRIRELGPGRDLVSLKATGISNPPTHYARCSGPKAKA